MRVDSFRGKLEDAIRRLTLVPQTLRLVWGAAPRWCLLWAFLLLFQGVVPAVLVLLTKPVTDTLVALAQAGFTGPVLREFLLLAGAYAMTLWISEVIGGGLAGVRSVQAELVEDYITDQIHIHAIGADLAFYESPEYHDQLHRAREQASSRSLSLLENIGGVIQSVISLLAITAILFSYGPLVALLLIFGAAPAAFVLIRHQWLNHRWWLRTTTQRRWVGYYDAYLTSAWAAEEQQLFGWGPIFRSAYRDVRRVLRKEHFELIRKRTVSQMIAASAALLIAGAAGAWMVWRMSRGLATLGDLALFYNAFSQGQGRLRSVFTGAAQIFSNLLFVESLYEVLDRKPQITSPDQPIPVPSRLREGIRFEGVSFRYPETDRLVLENFDLFIPAGKSVAIVGQNGAGKSTLIKLLCRFYDPAAGRVTIDRIDVRNLARDELHGLITVLFQSPVSYVATVEENINISDLRQSDADTSVIQAAKSAGAHGFIEKLPKSYETLLGKLFPEGITLSGGEAQRVALARAFYRDSPIIVLDEPTSFMDSWAENEWHGRFRKLSRGKTVLVITHRFTTAMRADLIYVMQDGEVVEGGTHAELVAQRGRYAESWEAQMSGS